MNLRKGIVSLLLLISITSFAQEPGQLLAEWAVKAPIEKVYLHFDRENYIAGETVWFKAYLYSDYQPDTISTTLYTELLNEKGILLQRVALPVLLGMASGHFELPDTLATAVYLIRTYSPTMLNQDAEFAGKQQINVYGKKNKTINTPVRQSLRLEFFPEGGNLLNGFAGTVAFKASTPNGLPASAKGKILNDKNDLITTFSSYHDGMGMFELTPRAGEKYFAQIDGDNTVQKYELPAAADKGISLALIPHPQGNFFEIKQRNDDPAFQVAYMIGQMQHHVVFKQEFTAGKAEIQGVINTGKLHSGILQVTFFNKDGQPLAERLCFVNNKEYILPGQLVTDTINFSQKGKNHFSLQLKDTILGNFSVAITDDEYNSQQLRKENIFSTLFLTADLKGYIHNPAFYFSADTDSVKTALDLVMMTNGWRRFSWKELSGKLSRPLPFKDLSYITLEGKVNLRDGKKAFAEKPMVLMLITADSSRNIQMIHTDKLGQFRLDSMLFFGRSKLLFSDIRGKKSQYIDVKLSVDSLTKPYPLLAPSKELFAVQEPAPAYASMIENDYDAILKASGIMLEGITVKARKKNPIAELEEKYASGLFSGDASKTIDLVNNNETDPYLNIFDYLRTRVPGVQIQNDGFDYEVYYRQTGTISSLGNPPMILYLDEIETEASVISTIPANQIAMVKLFSNFAAATGNAMGGVLAIYTKKGTDMNNLMQHAADVMNYNGYTVTKEFYAPDYAVDKSLLSQADNRITIDWQPNLIINSIDPVIPLTFYNNDRTKKFRVVIEGMTTDGKMLMIEKTISNTKGF